MRELFAIIRVGGGTIKNARCRELGDGMVRGFGVWCGYMWRTSKGLSSWGHSPRQH